MVIESLHITDFGNLHDFRLDLGEGMTVIEGKNEAGKSTVAEFLRFVLYGFSGKADRERYGSLPSGAAEGSLTLNSDGKRYRVERQLVGKKESVGIIDLENGTPCYEGKVPGEVFLGIPSSLFTETAFVGQTSGGRVDGQSTAEAIDNLLFSGSEAVNLKKSLDKLDKLRTELLYKNKKGGRLFEIDGELSALRSRLAEASRSSAEIISLEGSIAELKEKTARDKKALEEVTFFLAQNEKLEARRRREKIRSLEKDYNAAKRNSDRFKETYTRNGFFPSREYYEQLRESMEAVSLCDRRIEEIKRTVDGLNRELLKEEADRSLLDREEEKKRGILSGKRKLALACGILFCVLFIPSVSAAAVLFMAAKPAVGIPAAIFSFLFLCAMAGSFLLASRYAAGIAALEGSTQREEDDLRVRLEEIREQLRTAEEERAHRWGALSALCEKWGTSPTAKTLSDVNNVLKEAERLGNEEEKCRYAYVNMKSGITDSQVDPEDDGSPISLPSGFNPTDAKKRRDLLSDMISRNEHKINEKKIELARLSTVAVSPAELQEKITALEYKKTEAQERYDAILLAYEKLGVAGESLRSTVSPRLSETSGRFMGAVTEGKYREIGVGNGLSMTFRPKTQGGGAVTVGEEYMSAGTADAAYVSLRLALVSLICGKKLPPIVFDESFARLDDGRLENMMRLLAASGAQILILTSTHREAALLEKIGGGTCRTLSAG